MNYICRFGTNAFIFSRRPTAKECEWLLAGYDSEGEACTVKACPDSIATDDAILARVAGNFRSSVKGGA